MEVYERNDLKEEAEAFFGNVEAVFVQEDVLDVHIFTVYKDGDGLVVGMANARKPSKVELPTFDEMVTDLDAMEDEQRVGSLKEALDLVCSGNKLNASEKYTALQGETDEETKLANMSKYQRKVYLREKAS